MLAQIADLDRLPLPLLKPFVDSRGVSLFDDQEAMCDFLSRPHSETGCDDWKTETGRDWHFMYKDMQKTYRSMKIPTTGRTERSSLVKNGLLDIFTAAYNAQILNVVDASVMRKAGNSNYQIAFADYVEALISAVEEKFDLINSVAAPKHSFESQLVPKLRFLTADTRGEIAPLPLFCLPYALAVVAEFNKYILSIREVSCHSTNTPHLSYPKLGRVSPFCVLLLTSSF